MLSDCSRKKPLFDVSDCSLLGFSCREMLSDPKDEKIITSVTEIKQNRGRIRGKAWEKRKLTTIYMFQYEYNGSNKRPESIQATMIQKERYTKIQITQI